MDKQNEVPVLTDVVDETAMRSAELDAEAVERIARELERALLERFAPELERIIGEIVREALAASLARK